MGFSKKGENGHLDRDWREFLLWTGVGSQDDDMRGVSGGGVSVTYQRHDPGFGSTLFTGEELL